MIRPGQIKLQYFIFILPVVILFVLNSACTRRFNEKPLPPDDLIPQEQMADVILDFHVYDAIMNTLKRKPKKIRQEEGFYLYNSILEKHQVTREQFRASFKYYQSDIEIMDAIYAEVDRKLSLMKNEIEKTD
jgi:hypothetical protein